MNPRNALRALMIVGLAAFVAGRVEAQAWIPQPGEYYSELRGSAWRSDEFYDDFGERQLYGGGTRFESRELLAYNEIKKSMALGLGLPVRSVTLESASSSFQTETGLADLQLGLRGKLIDDGRMGLTVQAEWRAPLGYQRDLIPRLGPGQQNVGGKVSFGTSFASINSYLEFSSTYTVRFEDPPNELNDDATFGVWAGPAILLQALYLDGYSMGKWPASSGRAEYQTNFHSGGLGVTYRVDDRLDVFAKSLIQFAGRNVEKSNRYAVGVAFKNTHFNRLQGYLGGMRRH
jgi:hypothetical protein